MTVECTSCDTCCPESVDVTIEENNYTIGGAGVDITVADQSPVDATKKDITIQAVDADGADLAGTYLVRLWFVDDYSNPNEPTPVPPTSPGWVQEELLTDSTGKIEFTVENASLTRWYLFACLGGGAEYASVAVGA